METEMFHWLSGLLTGLIAGGLGGLMAGLAGVGGGLIYVPMLYLAMPGNNAGAAAHVFGSMVAVVLTGLFSARSHWRLGHIDAGSLKLLLPGLGIGAAVGLWSTLHLSEVWILLGLGLLDAWIARDYGRDLRVSAGKRWQLMLMAWPVGYLSGSLGIGGGTMLTPALRRSLPLRMAVGTSAMCGMLMACLAVTINIGLEANWRTLLAPQADYLLGFWIGILLILPVSTRHASRLHARVDEAMLRRVLKVVFAVLSATLLAAALLRS